MSWHPNDLVSDADLLAYERTILTQFNVADWQAKRLKALEDWLWPQLRERGYPAERFRTRIAATSVLSSTSSVFTDQTDAASDATADDLNLTTILAAGTDYLALGSAQQFRGVSVRVLDGVNSVAATLTVESWQDAWTAMTVTDTTQLTIGKPFSKGGTVIWVVPDNWTVRALNSSDPLYWVRLRLSAAPTGLRVGQISCIRRSVLCAPATFRTLALIFREAPVSHKSPWIEKADFYEREAQLAINRAWPLVGGEFDLNVPPDDVVDATEIAQTSDTAATPFRWERA